MADRSKKVLVVDDEHLIARSLAFLARKGGLEPTMAYDGLEAWRLFEDAPRSWGLLITDIRMPGLDGVSLAQRIRAGGSSIPVVFISGHSQPPDVEELSPAIFLAKPFTRAQLFEAIEAVEASERGAGGPSPR